jgi:hypothetical protein
VSDQAHVAVPQVLIFFIERKHAYIFLKTTFAYIQIPEKLKSGILGPSRHIEFDRHLENFVYALIFLKIQQKSKKDIFFFDRDSK